MANWKIEKPKNRPNANRKCAQRWLEKDIASLLLLLALHFLLRFFRFCKHFFFHSCVHSRVFVEYRQFWNATPMQNNPKKAKPHSLNRSAFVSGCICLWKYFNFANFSLLPHFIRPRISDSISFPSKQKMEREKTHTNLVSFPPIVKHFRHSSNRIFFLSLFLCWLFFDRQMNQINKYLLPLPLRKIKTPLKKSTEKWNEY